MKATRAVLIAPGNRPDLLEKLPRSEPDAVIVDLEDGVAPAGKDEARVSAGSAARLLTERHPDLRLYLRLNALRSEWFVDDLSIVAVGPWHGLVLPKVEAAADLRQVRQAVGERGGPELPIVAGIETALGVHRVDAILEAAPQGLYWGAEDYVTDVGGVRTEAGLEVLHARSVVALAARIHGVWSLDQIVPAYRDDDRFRRDAQQGRALGFTGKVCIHPQQVPIAREVFGATEEQFAWAEGVLRAHARAAQGGGGVATVDGQMVDEPMVRRARDVVARANP